MLHGLLERDPTKRISTLAALQACDFFGANGKMPPLDWQQLKLCSLPSPFKPDADGAINAEDAQDIADATIIRTASYRQIELLPDERLELTSVASIPHQKDIVAVLEMERKGELDFLMKSSRGCCICS